MEKTRLGFECYARDVLVGWRQQRHQAPPAVVIFDRIGRRRRFAGEQRRLALTARQLAIIAEKCSTAASPAF
jgi:hypothetical protein